ncbi:hypothetical protein A4A49_05885 [Nicotiana attenuata]|uniref:Uncharacterized protein n=1 Tax=Nicotiana attenuata TaxID=49451 RepID=A0A314L0B3_NICAT|nr:hypothetical protein A4A49_05885 [Nicotiana attenuata]
MENFQGIMGKLGRQCYAVFCLWVLLISVAVAHYSSFADQESNDQSRHERTRRRLQAVQTANRIRDEFRI